MRGPSLRLLKWAEEQVDLCRSSALRYFQTGRLQVSRKADGSPVTQADRAIEEKLRKALQKDFPGETIVGEEYGTDGSGQDTYWTIDPIDGTRAFASGLPSWGILLGRVENGKAVLGVCDFPAIGVRLLAAGKDAFESDGRRRRRLPQAEISRSLKESVIFHGGASWWLNSPYASGFKDLIDECFLERAYGDCYAYLWLFRNRADCILEYGVAPWDVVPLAAIAAATGREVRDCNNRPCLSGPEMITAAPRMASIISRKLKRS